MKKNNNRFWRFLYKLHRYIGLISAIVLIIISVTGIALNHTEDLQLDSNMVQAKAILDWYGIQPPDELKSFATENHWLTLVNQSIYFNDWVLSKNHDALLGAIETDEFIAVALQDSLLMLSIQGELIEQVPLNQLQLIGLDQQNIVLKAADTLIYSNDGLLSWNPYQGKQVVWSKISDLPENKADIIKTQLRSSILPLERVLLDMHSGRFLGYFGVILVDISGVFLIILAMSGCAIWLKHKLRLFRRLK